MVVLKCIFFNTCSNNRPITFSLFLSFAFVACLDSLCFVFQTRWCLVVLWLSIRSYDLSCLAFLSFFLLLLLHVSLFQTIVRANFVVRYSSNQVYLVCSMPCHIPRIVGTCSTERQRYNLIHECSLFSSCRCCLLSTRALSNANVSALSTSASSSTRPLADTLSLSAMTKASLAFDTYL